MHNLGKLIVGLLVMTFGLYAMGMAGGTDTLTTKEDFRPGDTLRYTTDGSTPNRNSRFVIYGANKVVVNRTTTFNAILYRPGFLPTKVQTRTVYVQDGAPSGPPLVRK